MLRQGYFLPFISNQEVSKCSKFLFQKDSERWSQCYVYFWKRGNSRNNNTFHFCQVHRQLFYAILLLFMSITKDSWCFYFEISIFFTRQTTGDRWQTDKLDCLTLLHACMCRVKTTCEFYGFTGTLSVQRLFFYYKEHPSPFPYQVCNIYIYIYHTPT